MRDVLTLGNVEQNKVTVEHAGLKNAVSDGELESAFSSLFFPPITGCSVTRNSNSVPRS